MIDIMTCCKDRSLSVSPSPRLYGIFPSHRFDGLHIDSLSKCHLDHFLSLYGILENSQI